MIEFEPPHRFAARDNIGAFLLVANCVFEPAGEDATMLQVWTDTTASGVTRFVMPLMKPMFRSTVRRSLQRIKAMVEQEYGAASA